MYWRGEERRRGGEGGRKGGETWREVGWGQGMAFITYGRKRSAAAAKKPRRSEQRFSESQMSIREKKKEEGSKTE